MEYRTLDINVISAKDLKKVNLISKTRAYVVVSLSCEPRASQQRRTAVDRRGNANPTWNFPLNFTVNESAAQSDRLVVTFRIRCQRFLGDKDIGELDVEILRPVENGKLQFVTHKVGNKSGKSQGELNFSYKWSKKIVRATTPMATKVNKAQEPVTAFPARVRSSSANPPPPTRNAYQSQQSSTGLEMDAALSGLLIADIISNVSHHCGGGCGGGGSGVSGGGGCGGGGGGGGGGCGGGGGGSGVSGGGGCGGGCGGGGCGGGGCGGGCGGGGCGGGGN